MFCRGVRGATTASENSKEAIAEATQALLREMLAANEIELEAVASAFFTCTPDLTAEFPAWAARQIGWTEIALMCAHEMSVPGMLPLCIRVLLHVNTEKSLRQIRHIYTRGAINLRPATGSQ